MKNLNSSPCNSKYICTFAEGWPVKAIMQAALSQSPFQFHGVPPSIEEIEKELAE